MVRESALRVSRAGKQHHVFSSASNSFAVTVLVDTYIVFPSSTSSHCPKSPIMRPSPIAFRAKPSFQPHVGRFTPAAVFKWAPTLALWGGAGAGAVMLFMSSVPIFKKDILIKLPVIAPYFEDKTHPADNAF